MLFRALEDDPQKIIPVAMALIVIGLSCLLFGLAWPTFSHVFPNLGTGSRDFIHGLFFGIAIVLEIGGVVLATSATAAAAKKS
jgi:hypothetical protein